MGRYIFSKKTWLCVVCAAIMLAPSVSYAQEAFPIPLSGSGRYVAGFLAGKDFSASVVLDTETGKLWHIRGSNDALYLKPVPYVKDCPKPADGKKYDCKP